MHEVYKAIILHCVDDFFLKFTHRFQNLHIFKYYLKFLPTMYILVDVLSKGWQAFIVNMFRQLPEECNEVSNNGLISGFWKAPMMQLTIA